MGKFDGILICTDLDGTLLRNDKTISEENREAIEYFKSEGGYFTFVTGRVPCVSRMIYEMVRPNAPVGCINGAGIYDFEKNEYLWSTTVSPHYKELITAVIEAIPGVGAQVSTHDAVYFCRENESMVKFRRRTGAPNLVVDYKTFDEPITKVLFGEEDGEKIQKIIEILNNHPKTADFDYIRSERMLYEILPKGSSKGNLLMKLAEILGVDARKTVAIGDYNNDVSMIKAAGVGVAVANAVDEAKAVADIVTVSNEEHAIAKIIEMIGSGEIQF